MCKSSAKWWKINHFYNCLLDRRGTMGRWKIRLSKRLKPPLRTWPIAETSEPNPLPQKFATACESLGDRDYRPSKNAFPKKTQRLPHYGGRNYEAHGKGNPDCHRSALRRRRDRGKQTQGNSDGSIAPQTAFGPSSFSPHSNNRSNSIASSSRSIFCAVSPLKLPAVSRKRCRLNCDVAFVRSARVKVGSVCRSTCKLSPGKCRDWSSA